MKWLLGALAVWIERHRRPSSDQEGVAVAEPQDDPIENSIGAESVTEGYLEIIEKDGGRVVTIIEVVNLANKMAGEGRQSYRRGSSCWGSKRS